MDFQVVKAILFEIPVFFYSPCRYVKISKIKRKYRYLRVYWYIGYWYWILSKLERIKVGISMIWRWEWQHTNYLWSTCFRTYSSFLNSAKETSASSSDILSDKKRLAWLFTWKRNEPITYSKSCHHTLNKLISTLEIDSKVWKSSRNFNKLCLFLVNIISSFLQSDLSSRHLDSSTSLVKEYSAISSCPALASRLARWTSTARLCTMIVIVTLALAEC